MPTFKNARKVQPVTPSPSKKAVADLGEEIRPLSPRQFPSEEKKTMKKAAAKESEAPKVAATTVAAPESEVKPSPPPPPQPQPTTKPAAKTEGAAAPSRFKAFLAGCFIGGCLSPAVLLALFFWVFTFATPTITKQLANIIPPEVKGLFTSKTSAPETYEEEPTFPIQTPESSPSPVIRVQPVNCGQDANCLLLAAKVCQSADGVIVKKGLEAQVSITDLSPADTCHIEFFGTKALDSMERVTSLVGKGMTCYFAPSTINEYTFSLEYNPRYNCQGEMWEELKLQSKTLPSSTTQNTVTPTQPQE